MYGYSDALLGGFGTLLIILCLIGIGLMLAPGLIANKRNHPYKGLIWVVSIVGTILTGLGWLAALIWVLLPQEKPSTDPVVANIFAKQNASGGSSLASKLSEADALLAEGKITKDEYDVIRKRALGI
jgi:hypothetical protein